MALLGCETRVTASGFPAMHGLVIVDRNILIDAARRVRVAAAISVTLLRWTVKCRLPGNRFKTLIPPDVGKLSALTAVGLVGGGACKAISARRTLRLLSLATASHDIIRQVQANPERGELCLA